MKKKIISALCGCLLMFALVGCSNTSYQEATNTTTQVITEGNGYFTLITKWDDDNYVYKIVYANDTKVKYLIVQNTTVHNFAFGVTPLYNTDGSLQVYGEED